MISATADDRYEPLPCLLNTQVRDWPSRVMRDKGGWLDCTPIPVEARWIGSPIDGAEMRFWLPAYALREDAICWEMPWPPSAPEVVYHFVADVPTTVPYRLNFHLEHETIIGGQE